MADYTVKLQSDNVNDVQNAANALSRDQQADILLAALKSDKVKHHIVVLASVYNCFTPAVIDAMIAIVKQNRDAQMRSTALEYAATGPTTAPRR